LDVSGTGDIIIQGKATAQARNSYKNVTLKDIDPPRLNHSLGQKTNGPQVPVHCVTPLQFFRLFFTSEMINKITAETNAYAKEKIANKTVSRLSIWHGWYDVVEEEMLAFLGLIINMGVIHVPSVKDCLSQQFVCRVPFFVLGIISVDSDATGQPLIIYSAFVKYLRKNGNTMKQCIALYRLQESL